MLFKCYLRNGIVYVPTVGLRRGVYTTIEPVEVVPVANTEGLRRAFFDVIAHGNITVVPPPKGKWPPPVLLKYAGVKSWSAFTRGTETWNIEENDGIYKIVGNRKHEDGYWVEDHDRKIVFPSGTSISDIVDRMIAVLQDAASR